MIINFKYVKDGEVINCEHTAPKRAVEKGSEYCQRYLVRNMISYIYDHDIEEVNWVGAWIYERDTLIASVTYHGNITIVNNCDNTISDKIKAVVLGHAIGDALGVPVEFCYREELKKNPVTDMIGFGSYDVPAGSWSDDTSMSLCTLESLAKGKIDYNDIMNNFGKWYYNNEFTPTGNTFDVGTTCSFAIHNYHKANCTIETCGLDEEMANGNGSLMRIHPMALFTFAKGMSLGKSLDAIYKTSALTHAHPRSKLGCGIYSMLLWKLLKSPSKEEAAKELENTYVFYDGGARVSEKEYDHYSELSHFDFAYKASLLEKTEDDIVGSGYIVDALEAALWCLLTTDSYNECVLKAVNLGDDTDTTAAIAGGLAGALYGLDAIPEEWLVKLKRRDYIEDMCERAYRAWIEK